MAQALYRASSSKQRQPPRGKKRTHKEKKGKGVSKEELHNSLADILVPLQIEFVEAFNAYRAFADPLDGEIDGIVDNIIAIKEDVLENPDEFWRNGDWTNVGRAQILARVHSYLASKNVSKHALETLSELYEAMVRAWEEFRTPYYDEKYKAVNRDVIITQHMVDHARNMRQNQLFQTDLFEHLRYLLSDKWLRVIARSLQAGADQQRRARDNEERFEKDLERRIAIREQRQIAELTTRTEQVKLDHLPEDFPEESRLRIWLNPDRESEKRAYLKLAKRQGMGDKEALRAWKKLQESSSATKAFFSTIP